MKILNRFALPACALALIYVLLRDREAPGQPPVPAGHVPSVTASTAPGGATTLPGETASTVASPPARPAADQPSPRTIKDLNTFADSPKPLADKMVVLTRMMREDTPDRAKAAAVRAVYLVKNGDFKEHLLPLILAGDLKQEAMDVLGLNLYDRPLDVLLPSWALIRDRPGHPLQAAAADGLEFHLKEKAAGGDLTQVIRDYLKPEVH